MRERFTDANGKLEAITKELANYLEVKRLAFPRFYFLDNEGLLQILSQTKNPRNIQPYCEIIFEGIKKLEFDEAAAKAHGEEELAITALLSNRGERVELLQKIYPCKGSNMGNVELWATEICG